MPCNTIDDIFAGNCTQAEYDAAHGGAPTGGIGGGTDSWGSSIGPADDNGVNGGWDVPPGTIDTGTYSIGGINWNNVIAGGIGLGSQAIAGWSNNPTQQIGGIGVTGVGGGYSPAAINATTPRSAVYPTGTIIGASGLPNTAGGLGVDNTLNSLTGIITRNPLLILGGLAVFALWKSGRK